MVRIVTLLFLIFFNSQDTKDRFAHITDRKARKIIKASIDHAGGIDRWENLKQLKYKKNFSLFDANGKLEKNYEQSHNYSFEMDRYTIKSTVGNNFVQTSSNKGNYARTTVVTLDGRMTTQKEDDQDKLAKAMNTSIYVVSMPFKLLDPGADISYEGELTLEDGSVVDVIQVVYDADKYENHSSSEIWKYYFDKEDRKIVGNWIQSADHFNVVENLSFIRVDGILFNGKRKSWRIDEDGKILFIRAEYDYFDYEVY